jgi:hypothetical protein
LKINVALGELPNFIACPGLEPGPHHRGTIHISPDQDYIERAFDDAKYGQPSQRPILECTIPSVVDPTVAPPGEHLMSIFVQYAPYQLRGATWDDLRESFADRCFALLNEYAPNFQRSVLARQVLTPLDLERTFNLTGGNIFQGAMTLNQLFVCRPVPGFADYRTPISGLYLCGAAAHPGGGVMGAAGANAAREILRAASFGVSLLCSQFRCPAIWMLIYCRPEARAGGTRPAPEEPAGCSKGRPARPQRAKRRRTLRAVELLRGETPWRLSTACGLVTLVRLRRSTHWKNRRSHARGDPAWQRHRVSFAGSQPLATSEQHPI